MQFTAAALDVRNDAPRTKEGGDCNYRLQPPVGNHERKEHKPVQAFEKRNRQQNLRYLEEEKQHHSVNS